MLNLLRLRDHNTRLDGIIGCLVPRLVLLLGVLQLDAVQLDQPMLHANVAAA